ncbi:hypothetical protein M011DRAFT_470710 [Sporormia fimetaria CBS 119925]|uniref:Ribosome biogenesis protein Urb1 n=1 Tax=Sporormia fimetaria CBS 119925 TaxID=1340428 RepID=A0A6A6V522_9PLEO|nr:hypothetical protein M011DRAFT_470710 [Sporormia fimetaria CBS 119925]
MSKRTAPEAEPKSAHDPRHFKRQRIENPADRNSPRPAAVSEHVSSARQLQNSLVFDQASAASFRKGLSLLKSFLDSILYTADRDDLPRKRAILREFLETQKTGSRGDKDAALLPAFFQAWDSAVETNSDMLLSQVTACIALLLKVCATHVDFLEYGTLLCKAVLQLSVARKLSRSLSAPPSKENIISPTLRLLTEVTKYNEGAHAKAVYAKRDYTLEPKTLARNISLWSDNKTHSDDLQRRKPSIRSNAVRYLLTHLTYQDELAKTELLSNRMVLRSLFDHLHADPPPLIAEILGVMKHHVFLDKAMVRSTKSAILTGRTLSNIANLYKYETSEEPTSDEHKGPQNVAHDFLCLVCTSPAYGVMLPSNGFYPPADEEDDADMFMEDAADNGYAAVMGLTEPTEGSGRVRNIILDEFIRSLRPHASTLQQELVLAIFKACPELIAPYFHLREAFNFDAKLTSTWIGYSAFIYRTIELPVPQQLGAKRIHRDYPPSASVVIQSIVPQPMTQQVLTKCLNSSAELINLFAIRLLIIAFHKLQKVLQEYDAASASNSSQAWQQGRRTLLAEFSRRCPPIKTVILAFKRPVFQKNLLRESIVRLIRSYYEVLPQAALQEKFDVSVPLCNALLQAGQTDQDSAHKAFKVMELEHWIQIARHASSMRWWQKDKTLPYSPFIMLLKLIVTSTEGDLYKGIKSLLSDMLRDQEMLQFDTQPHALDGLLASLVPCSGLASPPHEVLEFLDSCCAFFTKKPIKYLDDLDVRREQSRDGVVYGPISPVVMTLVEQWPFKGGKPEKGNPAEPIAQWLAKLLYLLKLIGEDESLLASVRDSLVSSADTAYQQVLNDAFLWKMGKESAKEALKSATGADFSSPAASSSPSQSQQLPATAPKAFVPDDSELPPGEDEKHTGLNRWRKKDVEEAMDDGDIGELLLCLCSKHAEIRLQALSGVRQLIATIDGREDGDLLQLKLLLGEAHETAVHDLNTKPLPYVGGVFAARAATVLADPSHFMYGKINEFLMKRPEWNVGNIPLYFARNIINTEADQDGSYHQEVDWYLDYVFDSLRTAEDMEIFRTKNIFERLLSFYVSASCSVLAKEKIVRLLLRAAAVGGSTTLITRCGILSWIQIQLVNSDRRQGLLRRLAEKVWENCDKEKVREWSGGTMEACVAAITQAA